MAHLYKYQLRLNTDYTKRNARQPVSNAGYMWHIEFNIDGKWKDFFFNAIEQGKPPVIMFQVDAGGKPHRVVVRDYGVTWTESTQKLEIGMLLICWQDVKQAIYDNGTSFFICHEQNF